MRRIRLYALLAAALLLAGLLPMQGHDVGELLPVQVLVVRRDEQGVLLTCDHGVSGRGESFSAALDDLERSAPGALFLDTAEHLVLASGAWDLAREAVECGRFRPAAKLYLGQGTLPEEQALAAYLRAHPGRVTLAQLQAALLRQENVIPPRLICREGRMHLAN